MHRIINNDLYFLHHACRANPAGTVILLVFWSTKLVFFTNFTLRALLQRNYCNALMLLTRNCRFHPKTRVFLQRWHVFAKYVSRNPKYFVSRVLLSRIRTLIFFCNLLKTQVNASYSPYRFAFFTPRMSC